MRLIKKEILVSVLLFITIACSSQQKIVVDYTNPNIAYEGRIDTAGTGAADLYWSATSIKINFKGKSISALMKDERGKNYYNIILDGDSIFVLQPDTAKHYYQLASGLSDGKHTVEIFKRTEWDRGKTSFYGFKIEGDAELLARPPHKKRKIEFYGNSITAGYAVDDFSGQDRSDSIFTNNYLSYSTLVAHHYDAEYYCICKSGIGIMISWFPMIESNIYNKINPEDPTSLWDFSKYTPDLVVINLFQNDSWLVNMPDRAEFKTNFGKKPPTDKYIIKSYKDFVSSIREVYPKAQIICILGSMDATQEGSKWPGYVTEAVKEMNDPEIYTHFIPFKNTPGHPSVKEQEEMAKNLIKFIDENIKW